AALGVFVLWLTFFITPFHYTDCFSVRQIGYGGKRLTFVCTLRASMIEFGGHAPLEKGMSALFLMY
ncbi:hypothetical protein, partial [Ruthenibacterium lactatiformans]|uniref:hypothetical protein n=1 Tax=Ruthenibacterium lactatiformans TaxID=1550024 RepID=UPI00196855C2